MARGDAAKKAWALYRAKYGTKGRSPSRSGGGTASRPRKRRRFLGVLGKSGMIIMVGAPLAGATAEAVVAASPHTMSGHPPSVGARVFVGFSTWINAISKGFGFKEPYGVIQVPDEAGNMFNISVQAGNTPKNVWWTTTFLGGFMVAIDRTIATVVKAAVKSPIGGFYLTGR